MTIPATAPMPAETAGDAPADATTRYTMAVGETFQGNISPGRDEDWVAVTLSMNTIYRIDQVRLNAHGDALSDPYLYLYDDTGTRIALNDDGGAGLESRLTHIASYTGVHYLGAGSYSTNVGDYGLTVTEIGQSIGGDDGPDTLTGRPAASTDMRATLRPSSPAWLVQPKMTSSRRAGSRPVRSSRAVMTAAARSSGRTPASAPPWRPIGVRTPSIRTTSSDMG